MRIKITTYLSLLFFSGLAYASSPLYLTGVRGISDCKQLENSQLPFHSSVFCPSSELYSKNMLEIALNIAGVNKNNYTITGGFTYFEIPTSPDNQTANSCLDSKGGAPLCNLIAHVTAAAATTNTPYPVNKLTVDYFKDLTSKYAINFGLNNTSFEKQLQTISNVTAYKAFSAKYPGDFMYSPNGQSFSLNSHGSITPNSNGYYGISGGGGSGAGFEIKLLAPGKTQIKDAKTVFTGGGGGGGGMTSPEYDTNYKNLEQLYVGTGGGGGTQFAGTGFNSALNGLGLGGGSSSNENLPTYTYSVSLDATGSRTQVINRYLCYLNNSGTNCNNLQNLRGFLQKKLAEGYTVLVLGGGGMGNGMEYLGKPTPAGQQEITPHALSSSGSFKFLYRIHKKTKQTEALMAISPNSPLNDKLTKFYANLGYYINFSTEAVLKQVHGAENRLTSEKICLANHAISITMAVNILGVENTPAWLRTSYCDFGQTSLMLMAMPTNSGLSIYQQTLVNTAKQLFGTPKPSGFTMSATQPSSKSGLEGAVQDSAKNTQEYFNYQKNQ